MDKPSKNKKSILVELQARRVTASEGDTVFHSCECVPGDVSHRTPVGKFHIIRKQHPYVSHTYHVPMNYAMFFKNTGEALHQYHGPLPWWALRMGRNMSDWFGSHGCVRLQEADAKQLYEWAPMGTPVEVR